jgi:hypothetical protein
MSLNGVPKTGEGRLWRECDRGRGLIRGDTSFPCVLIPATASASNISCYQLLATTGLYTQVACVSAGILYNDVSNAPWGGIARIFPSIEPSGIFGPSQPRPLHTKYDRSRHDHSSFPASGLAAHCDCPSWTTECLEAVDLNHFPQLQLLPYL